MVILNGLADFFTIIGVIFAIVVYCLWKHDYSLQKSHEYSLSLLKKFKYLHAEIESIRSPKLYNPDTISKDIEKKHIPQIEEKILKKIVEINVDLLIAEKCLIKHGNLQLKFNELIIQHVISPIRIAIYEFISNKDRSSFEVKDTELWRIIFPAQYVEDRHEDRHKIKRSVLGTNMEVINDDFNKIIENNFNTIYRELEANLAIKKDLIIPEIIKSL